MTERAAPHVLVVEDEPDVAETYEMWLGGQYDVRLAASGREALEKIDDSVDVVLLDRMMPEMSGDELLEVIRQRGFDCRVAMVTAVEPDFDIVEMEFDEYVVKPPSREGLRETLEGLLARAERTDRVQEYRSLLAKRAALDAQKGDRALEDSEAYAALQERIGSLEAELEADQERLLDDAEFVGALRALEEDRE